MNKMRKMLIAVFSVMFLVCSALFAVACSDDEPVDATTYTVTTTAGAHGTVSLSPDSADGKYAEGTSITVTVTPDTDYEVDTFTVNGTAAALTNNAYTFEIKQDTAIAATFKAATSNPAEEYTITIGAHEHGNITLTPAQEKYSKGAKVTIAAIPDTDYTVKELKIDGTAVTLTANSTYELTVEKSVTVSATFEQGSTTPVKEMFTITIGAHENGEIKLAPAAADNKYEKDSTVTVTFEPAEGYALNEFKIDDAVTPVTNNTYELKVTGNVTLSATFVQSILPAEYIGTWKCNNQPDIVITATEFKYDNVVYEVKKEVTDLEEEETGNYYFGKDFVQDGETIEDWPCTFRISEDHFMIVINVLVGTDNQDYGYLKEGVDLPQNVTLPEDIRGIDWEGKNTLGGSSTDRLVVSVDGATVTVNGTAATLLTVDEENHAFTMIWNGLWWKVAYTAGERADFVDALDRGQRVYLNPDLPVYLSEHYVGTWKIYNGEDTTLVINEDRTSGTFGGKAITVYDNDGEEGFTVDGKSYTLFYLSTKAITLSSWDDDAYYTPVVYLNTTAPGLSVAKYTTLFDTWKNSEDETQTIVISESGIKVKGVDAIVYHDILAEADFSVSEFELEILVGTELYTVTLKNENTLRFEDHVSYDRTTYYKGDYKPEPPTFNEHFLGNWKVTKTYGDDREQVFYVYITADRIFINGQEGTFTVAEWDENTYNVTVGEADYTLSWYEGLTTFEFNDPDWGEGNPAKLTAKLPADYAGEWKTKDAAEEGFILTVTADGTATISDGTLTIAQYGETDYLANWDNKLYAISLQGSKVLFTLLGEGDSYTFYGDALKAYLAAIQGTWKSEGKTDIVISAEGIKMGEATLTIEDLTTDETIAIVLKLTNGETVYTAYFYVKENVAFGLYLAQDATLTAYEKDGATADTIPETFRATWNTLIPAQTVKAVVLGENTATIDGVKAFCLVKDNTLSLFIGDKTYTATLANGILTLTEGENTYFFGKPDTTVTLPDAFKGAWKYWVGGDTAKEITLVLGDECAWLDAACEAEHTYSVILASASTDSVTIIILYDNEFYALYTATLAEGNLALGEDYTMKPAYKVTLEQKGPFAEDGAPALVPDGELGLAKDGYYFKDQKIEITATLANTDDYELVVTVNGAPLAAAEGKYTVTLAAETKIVVEAKELPAFFTGYMIGEWDEYNKTEGGKAVVLGRRTVTIDGTKATKVERDSAKGLYNVTVGDKTYQLRALTGKVAYLVDGATTIYLLKKDATLPTVTFAEAVRGDYKEVDALGADVASGWTMKVEANALTINGKAATVLEVLTEGNTYLVLTEEGLFELTLDASSTLVGSSFIQPWSAEGTQAAARYWKKNA